jgi:hypothetical protein
LLEIAELQDETVKSFNPRLRKADQDARRAMARRPRRFISRVAQPAVGTLINAQPLRRTLIEHQPSVHPMGTPLTRCTKGTGRTRAANRRLRQADQILQPQAATSGSNPLGEAKVSGTEKLFFVETVPDTVLTPLFGC